MTDTEKLNHAKQALQKWIDAQGHDRCWYYPDIFRELVELFDLKPTVLPELPPRAEFEQGCRRYQEEEYRHSH